MDLVIMMILGSIEALHYDRTKTTLQIKHGVIIDNSLWENFPLFQLNSIRTSGILHEDLKRHQLPSALVEPLDQQPHRIPFSNTSASDHLMLW